MTQALPTGWTCERPDYRYVRTDGAVARYDDRTPYSNPAVESARMWTVWEPDPGDRALLMGRRSSKFLWPRRFHTATAAMKAADRAWPLGR